MRRWAVGVAVGAVFLAGCAVPDADDGQSVGALVTPDEVVPVRPAALFDPCVEIPDEALEAVGVDPASQYVSWIGNEKISGEHWDDHRECAWRGEHHRVWIASVILPIDEVRKETRVENVTDITINGRGGIRYNSLSCSTRACAEIAFPAGSGSVWVNVSLSSLGDRSLHANHVVKEYATILEAYLPAD